jgi:hypothetical protein
MNLYAQTIRVAVTAITNWWFLWAQHLPAVLPKTRSFFAVHCTTLHVPTQQLETGCLRVSNAPHEQCKDANTGYQHRNSYRAVIEPMPCR